MTVGMAMAIFAATIYVVLWRDPADCTKAARIATIHVGTQA